MSSSSSYFNQVNYKDQPVIGKPHRTGLAPYLTNTFPQSTNPLEESIGTLDQTTSGLPDMWPFTRVQQKMMLDPIIQSNPVPLPFQQPSFSVVPPHTEIMISNYDIDLESNLYYDGTRLGGNPPNSASINYKEMIARAEYLKNTGRVGEALLLGQEAVDYLQLHDPRLAMMLVRPDLQQMQPVEQDDLVPDVVQVNMEKTDRMNVNAVKVNDKRKAEIKAELKVIKDNAIAKRVAIVEKDLSARRDILDKKLVDAGLAEPKKNLYDLMKAEKLSLQEAKDKSRVKLEKLMEMELKGLKDMETKRKVEERKINLVIKEELKAFKDGEETDRKKIEKAKGEKEALVIQGQKLKEEEKNYLELQDRIKEEVARIMQMTKDKRNLKKLTGEVESGESNTLSAPKPKKEKKPIVIEPLQPIEEEKTPEYEPPVMASVFSKKPVRAVVVSERAKIVGEILEKYPVEYRDILKKYINGTPQFIGTKKQSTLEGLIEAQYKRELLKKK